MTATKPRLRSRGGLVTLGTVVSLVAGLGLTVLGLGAADEAVASFDAASWVWSKTQGEMARINGVTAKVDTRVDLQGGRGHEMQVTQTDRYIVLRDANTGLISTMDLASLKTYQSLPENSGVGVSVALHQEFAFVIDSVRGIVRQLDPSTLKPIGEELRFPPGITGGLFDDQGKLWVAVPSQGTVSAIVPAPVGSAAPGGASPSTVSTVSVAQPSQDLAISALDEGVAVLNRTTNVLTTIRGGTPQSTTLALTAPGTLAPHTDGRSVPVTVPDARRVFVVTDGVARDFPVPGQGAKLQAAVAWKGYYYVADQADGTVHVLDGAGQRRKNIAFPKAGGPLELEVRENYLFINAPGSSTARVVDDAHQVRTVDKYADDVLGGDPPPTPPAPPPPPPRQKPKKPPVTEPGAPRNVKAAAGNAEARVTWQAADANGAAITRYVVAGNGKTFQVGAGQRSLTVTGLTNGETYEFAVHAVNAKGDGPERTSNPVRPTSEVPDAPAEVTAAAQPDGTVKVTWPAANGQGLEIQRYTVTAVSEGGSAPAGDADGTELTVKDGALEYGRQYAFTVTAVNERGAGSVPSPVSNSVVPYAKPGRPDGVEAATVGEKAGTVRVTWAAPPDNGRPITKYTVSAGGRSSEVTGTGAELDGFGAGETVAVEVRAVNEAGESEPGTATARTVAKPAVTVTGSSATFNTGTVSFTVNDGGGKATCTVAANNGGGSKSGSCTSVKLDKLKPSTSYTFTITATNAAGAGTATRAVATEALYGVATCINGESGDTATYCDDDRSGRNGNEIFSVTRQDNAKQVGWVKNGTRLEAYCKKSGEDVDSYIYNKQKQSTWWIQVKYEGKNYIPWAWLNLEGGDDLADLPGC